MLQLVGSPAGGPFTQLPLPVDAVTLVVVETALVTPALAAVADSSITSPEKASSAARRPEIRVLNMRALEKRSIRYLNVSGAGPFTTVQSHRRRRRRASTNPLATAAGPERSTALTGCLPMGTVVLPTPAGVGGV